MLVLAVDDDQDDLDLLKETLSRIHPTIICETAYDGLEALNYLRTDVIVVPDLIILDINMPYLNGRDTLVALRAIVALKSVPVMIFSTNIQPVDEILFKNYHAYYAPKPNSIEDWFRVINEIVKPLLKQSQ